jgi:hypothetical protein
MVIINNSSNSKSDSENHFEAIWPQLFTLERQIDDVNTDQADDYTDFHEYFSNIASRRVNYFTMSSECKQLAETLAGDSEFASVSPARFARTSFLDEESGRVVGCLTRRAA